MYNTCNLNPSRKTNAFEIFGLDRAWSPSCDSHSRVICVEESFFLLSSNQSSNSKSWQIQMISGNLGCLTQAQSKQAYLATKSESEFQMSSAAAYVGPSSNWQADNSARYLSPPETDIMLSNFIIHRYRLSTMAEKINNQSNLIKGNLKFAPPSLVQECISMPSSRIWYYCLVATLLPQYLLPQKPVMSFPNSTHARSQMCL